jgi:thioredoxin-related protein
MRTLKLTATMVVAAGLMLGASARAPAAEDGGAAPTLGASGMYTQTWFLESFLDLGEDLREARAGGKRFAIIWEQRGCAYCRETHVVNFAVPEIQNFVKGGFEILQLDIHGAREVTDFDGQAMSEKALATKYGVRYTPTITFYHDPPANDAKAINWRSLELTRLTGYYKPFHFLSAFRYVSEKAYERQKFGAFVTALRAERIKTGKPVKFR